MINQVTPNKLNNSSAFAPFLNENGANYAIVKPFTKHQKEGKKAEKERKSNALGFKIATIALASGFGVFALMKGLPGGLYKKIDKCLKYLDTKVDKLTKNKHLSKFKSFYISLLKGVKSIANKTKTLFNLTSLKDAVTSKGLKKVPMLNRMGNFITKVFEKISINTSQKAYFKTDKKFFDLFAMCHDLNTKLPKEKAAEISSKINDIQKVYNENFDVAAFAKRIFETKNKFENLDEKVWDATFNDVKGFVKNKNTYNTFIAEDLVAEPKANLINNLTEVKNNISERIKKDVLATYKDVLTEKDYLKLQKNCDKTIQSLDNAINIETDKLFDKLRDLKIGSAPTDTLGVLTSLGVIGWGLGKADNKDERTSVALKYGIPAVGAIATSLYCTVRLVSGGKAIILGLVSGALINKLGVYLDSSIKKYKEQPLTMPELSIKSVLNPDTNPPQNN